MKPEIEIRGPPCLVRQPDYISVYFAVYRATEEAFPGPGRDVSLVQAIDILHSRYGGLLGDIALGPAERNLRLGSVGRGKDLRRRRLFLFYLNAAMKYCGWERSGKKTWRRRPAGNFSGQPAGAMA